MRLLYLALTWSVLSFVCLDSGEGMPDQKRKREDWEMTSLEKSTRPFCTSILCINATCIAPEQCQCYVGYYHAGADSPNYICEPHCKDCSNGNCIRPGNCVCKSGYKKVNSRCEPVCKPSCVNGKCISPGECRCYAGFERSDQKTYECIPTCEKECHNSYCVAPNECRCHDFYYAVEDLSHRYSCEPYCKDCLNGDCIKPGDCKCHEGYERVHSRCEPVCQLGCGNGHCTSPDRCECNKGFELNHTTPHICDPICKKQCTGSTCVAPEECKCWEGYDNVEDTEERYSCEPHCDDCSNGDCIAPGNCVCKNGYEKVDSRCEPVCQLGCVNGHCTSPDRCECNKGFELNHTTSHVCDPICKKNCTGSTCFAPDECKCWEGYDNVEDTEERYSCEPHCDDCSNGDCIAPGNCVCKNGYKTIDSQCEPDCEPKCVNGHCVNPNMCECHEGFYKPNSSIPHVCHPFCDQECIKSSCVAPNVCKCWKGYINVEDTSNSYRCKQHCSNGCSHGDCIGPDECMCHIGYSLSPTNNTTLCLPKCDVECINGRCEAPNRCFCKKGTWKSSSFHCTPKCSVYPNDDGCYHDYRISHLLTKYTRNGAKASLELDASDVHVRVLFPHLRTSGTRSMVTDFMCFTSLRVEEDSADIVCSLVGDKIHNQPNDVEEWSVDLKVPSPVTTDLVFLHRNASGLRGAHICSNSNRVFIINGLSKLSLCMEVDEKTETKKITAGDKIVQGAVLYLSTENLAWISMIAIVAASSVVFIIAQCRHRKKTYYTCEPQDPISVGQIPLQQNGLRPTS